MNIFSLSIYFRGRDRKYRFRETTLQFTSKVFEKIPKLIKFECFAPSEPILRGRENFVRSCITGPVMGMLKNTKLSLALSSFPPLGNVHGSSSQVRRDPTSRDVLSTVDNPVKTLTFRGTCIDGRDLRKYTKREHENRHRPICLRRPEYE